MDEARRNEIAVKVAGYLWGQRRRQIYIPAVARFSQFLGDALNNPQTIEEDIAQMSKILEIPLEELKQFFEGLELPEPFASDRFSRSQPVSPEDLQ